MAPDRRTHVTEYGFRVDPSLLGISLATPWQRAAALLLDLIAVAALANAPAIVFGIAVVTVLLRATRTVDGGFFRRSARWTARMGAATVAFFVAVSLWSAASRSFTGDPAPARSAGVQLDGIPGMTAATSLVGFTMAPDEAAALEQADRVVAMLRDEGASDLEIAHVLSDLASARANRPWLLAAADSVGKSLDQQAPAVVADRPIETIEAVVTRWSTAIVSGDSSAAAAAATSARSLLAGDTIRTLHALLEREEATTAALLGEISRPPERPGIRAMLRGLLDDLGLGIGWSGLYFTAFLTFWAGQTPGKRALGIRVLRLDGKSIGWWSALGRFGGYAAGLATGLLGFAQIFWDDNRQAIQDKISETVVVRERPVTTS